MSFLFIGILGIVVGFLFGISYMKRKYAQFITETIESIDRIHIELKERGIDMEDAHKVYKAIPSPFFQIKK